MGAPEFLARSTLVAPPSHPLEAQTALLTLLPPPLEARTAPAKIVKQSNFQSPNSQQLYPECKSLPQCLDFLTTSIFKFRKWLKLLWNRGKGFSIFGDSSQHEWAFLPFFFWWLPQADVGHTAWNVSRTTQYVSCTTHKMLATPCLMSDTTHLML